MVDFRYFEEGTCIYYRPVSVRAQRYFERLRFVESRYAGFYGFTNLCTPDHHNFDYHEVGFEYELVATPTSDPAVEASSVASMGSPPIPAVDHDPASSSSHEYKVTVVEASNDWIAALYRPYVPPA